MRKIRYLALIILFSGAVFIWSVIFTFADNEFLEVCFFDVGQGDSIFIETPNQKQILIDGGPDKIILEKLNKTIAFYDRTIDLIILTHPDADHITGLIEVLEYYDVKYILTSGVEKDTAVYRKWRELIKKKYPLNISSIRSENIFRRKYIFRNYLAGTIFN